jgi:alpha-tubulin suppressor-like RCC1 family protein
MGRVYGQGSIDNAVEDVPGVGPATVLSTVSTQKTGFGIVQQGYGTRQYFGRYLTLVLKSDGPFVFYVRVRGASGQDYYLQYESRTVATRNLANGYLTYTLSADYPERFGKYASFTLDLQRDFAAVVSGDSYAHVRWVALRGPAHVGYLGFADAAPDLLADSDGDGLSGQAEEAAGTNPYRADTDGDGLLDGVEAGSVCGDPLAAAVPANPAGDPDADGIPTRSEVFLHADCQAGDDATLPQAYGWDAYTSAPNTFIGLAADGALRLDHTAANPLALGVLIPNGAGRFRSASPLSIRRSKVSFEVQTGEHFVVYVRVLGTNGTQYYVAYSDESGAPYASATYAVVPLRGLGYSFQAQSYTRVERNVAADLAARFPGVGLQEILWVAVRGRLQLKNVTFPANHLPVVVGVTTGSGPYFETSEISATVLASDADGDRVTLTYQWYVNGLPVAGETAPTLSGAAFAKGDAVFVAVTPHDVAGAGNPVLSNQVTIQNSAPALAAVSVNAGPYAAAAVLTAAPGAAYDADGDPVSLAYQWYVNGIAQPGAVGASFAGGFVRGDEVSVVATPTDGELAGAAVASALVTIGNTAPVMTAASLGAGPYGKADTLTAFALASDADNDAVTYTIRWFVNGAYVSTGAAFAGGFAKGDTVAAEVTPNDTFVDGAGVWTAPISVVDTAPVVTSAFLGSGPIYKTSTVTATALGTDADGDAVTLHYRWFVNGLVAAGETAPTLSGVFAKGDTVAVEVRAEAAGVQGDPAWSLPVGVANSAPVMSSVSLGAGPFSRNGTLTAAASAADADGDSVTYGYRWFVNGGEVGGATSSSLAGPFAPDVMVVVEVTPRDGLETGIPAVSAPAVIGNAPPGAPGVALFPGAVTAQAPYLWAQVVTASADPDGDAVTYAYAWYRNNVLQGYAATATLITAADVAGGDTWRVAVVASDGFAASAPATAGTAIYFASQSLALGENHTCTLTSAGGVKCWGYNGNGQLGTGDTANRLVAADVSGLTAGVKAIGAGPDFTCALTTAGGVKCWGANIFGQLGSGNTTQQLTPVNVVGLTSGVAAISLGYYHACALTDAGAVKCWGLNDDGQLGNGSTTRQSSPVSVSGLASGVSAIEVGNGHSCALLAGGGVKCWGDNYYGQLGNGNTTDQWSPVSVSGLASGTAAVSGGGSHTCALTTGGGVKCWGLNSSGQLGTGNTTQQLTPTDAVGLASGVAALSAGSDHTCAFTTAGGAKCWGNNSSYKLGRQGSPLTAADVDGLTSGGYAIVAGSVHTCAITSLKRSIRCWGSNGWGQLGNGGQGADLLKPAPVSGFESGGAQLVDAGYLYTCALTTGGGVKCWGTNGGGLGNGGTTALRPADVTGLASGVQAIAAGYHTCALTTSGGVKCWGYNSDGRVGNGTAVNQPLPVDVLASGVQAIAAGMTHTCALTTGGGVKCWGNNANGQLGIGNTTQQLSPVDVSGLSSGVMAIVAGDSYTCALTTAGGVKCWGYNSNGQLGNGNTTQQLSPVDVVGLSGVQAIGAGIGHTCASTVAGGLKCWGNNGNGQLGIGAASGNKLTPQDVVGLSSGVAGFAVGGHVTCAVTPAGAVKCWGWNSNGQLGVGDTTERAAPADVVGLGSGFGSVTLSTYHACATSTSGRAWCWGRAASGESGNPGYVGYVPYLPVVGFAP